MTKAINKLLAVTLSFAMFLTGFAFIGGAQEVSATDSNLPAIKNIIIDSAADSSASQPAEGGVYAWFFAGDMDADFSEVDGKAFSMQVKTGDADWVDSTVMAVFESGDNYDEGYVSANVPDNTETVVKQWRFVYAGESVECPAITQAAAEEAEPTEYTVTFDAEPGTVDPEQMTTTNGKLSTLPEPTPENEDYVFGGWTMFVSGEGEGAEPVEAAVSTDTVFTEDTTVFAKWIYKYWTSEDFEYGEWVWNSNDGLYPATDVKKLIQPELWVVTGFSESGKEKMLAGMTNIEIPYEDPNGKKVQGVGSQAFNYTSTTSKLGLPKITGVALPEVDRVPLEAIADDWPIKSETRGDFFIGQGAFNANSIKELIIPDGVVYIGGTGFAGNDIKQVDFPKSISYLGNQAFGRNPNLSNIYFPEETDLEFQTDAGSFGLSKITEVQLPKTVTKLNANTFMKANGQPIVELYIDGEPHQLVATSKYHNINNGILTHTATLEANGGSVEPTTIDIKYGKLSEGLPNPENDGNAFLGWFDKETDGKQVTDETPFGSNVILYAYWSDDEDLVDAQNKLIEAWDASYEAEQASEAAKKAANPAGQAAVDAAKKAQATAQAAVDKAKAAKAAADKAVAAMEAAVKSENDPELKAAKEAAEMAGYVVEDSQNMLNNANAAVDSAVKAKADADKKADEAKKEADRQGVYNAKLPKVKISKPKAAKKAVTVKWKKLSKKNQKKAQKIEVWVCPNKKFAAADTKMKTVSKKKASVKIKGLGKKKTYYVKVRSIKTVNGVKNVGKWSKVKKVKTK